MGACTIFFNVMIMNVDYPGGHLINGISEEALIGRKLP